jgi:hypothetical protein
VEIVSAEEAAHYLALGEPLLKLAVMRQMERDYIAVVTRLLDEIRPHLQVGSVPETPFGVITHPERIPDTQPEWLRSLAFEDADELLHSGEPEQALAWITSDAAHFLRQRFRRGEIDAWAASRGLSERRADPEGLPLNPKEKTALYGVIRLLAACLGLDLSRPTAATTRLLDFAAKEGIDVTVSQRTLDKHFRAVHDETERSGGLANDDGG